MEADSLNYSMLGPDAAPGTEEFDLFIKEVAKEMTTKAGQKCTAIRRTFVPENMVEDLMRAIAKRLESTTIGDPSVEGVRMGPLAGRGQVNEVRHNVDQIASDAELVFGNPDRVEVVGADAKRGAFFPSLLFYSDKSLSEPHDVEAFGPVNTVMPYRTLDDAIELAKRGRGSLVGSLFTANDETARQIVLGTAAYHGRLMLVNRHSAKESTGHGSPLPHLVHGGPGRAGRRRGDGRRPRRAALHAAHGAAGFADDADSRIRPVHGRRGRDDLERPSLPEAFRRACDRRNPRHANPDDHRRRCRQLRGSQGDNFYAHMSDDDARKGIFERRVAHGYFVLSAAAGLFVDPAPGPVLANYGLENLRFTKPVYPGDTIRVRLTVKQMTAKETPATGTGAGIPQGVVSWDVEVTNQDKDVVATYTVLTLVKRRG